MNTEEGIEVFIHPAGGKPVTVRVNPSDTLAQVLARASITPSADEHLFISAANDDAAEVGGEEDADEPVSHHTKAADAGLQHHGHVHCHPCRRIEVTVNLDKAKSRKFAPSARIARVRRWALRAFELSGPAASDFVLQICQSDQRPRLNQHLAELVKQGTCSICFDLVKEVTPQG